MKHQDAKKLKIDQTVYHRRYGKCDVREVLISMDVPGPGTPRFPAGELFGIVIRPVEQAGRDLLKQDCGSDIPEFLEDLPRNLSTEKPPIKRGEKPIDLETAWGDSEDDLPVQEDKNHFAVK